MTDVKDDARDDAPAGRELLRVEGVAKSFPGVRALDGVDLSLRAGEVHVLLGENGAGKSTLIKMLSGAHRPDAGRILVADGPADGPAATTAPDGLHEVRIRSAQDAERLGIATIYQEFNLVPGLTVAENIFLGRQPRTALRLIDRKTMRARAAELLRRVRLDVSPDTPVAELGIARLQMVEIAKALSLRARVLIMDEPTAVLTSEEVETLFAIVRELRDEGVGIIFITHHLEEIGALGDRVTVLRDGRSVAEVPAGTDEDELIRLMVGRDIAEQYPRQRPKAPGAPLLRVRGLTRHGPNGTPVFEGIDFEVRAGEVVGLAGLVGAGRTEVARAVFGVDRYDAGTVEIDGQVLAPRRRTGRDARRARPGPRGPQGPGPGPGRVPPGQPDAGPAGPGHSRRPGGPARPAARGGRGGRAAEGTDERARAARPHPLRWQPAEDRHRQVAAGRHPAADPRRADARHRRRREGRDLPAGQRADGGRPGGADDLQRPARGARYERPGAGHGTGTARR